MTAKKTPTVYASFNQYPGLYYGPHTGCDLEGHHRHTRRGSLFARQDERDASKVKKQ